MNKLLLILAIAFAPMVAMAGGPKGPGEPVLNEFSGYAWYQGTGSGMVHERAFCDEYWENCELNWQWFPTWKWPDGPDECEGIGPFYWGLIGSVGDGDHILVPDEYHICIKDKIFRQKFRFE